MATVSQPRHRRCTNLKTFLFGVPYYPEHWGQEEWADDAARMAAAGVNCVRMAEFAWDRMEPRPGEFDFSFFDEHVARLARYGIHSILCTPTAAPPAWLTGLHPETLRIDINGRRTEHGTRQHCCTNSPVFRQHSRKITRAMAEHFAGAAAVVGWQTDNELNCHFALCYCPCCIDAFRGWCRQRYGGDIGALNAAWGCAFWAMSYASFDELLPPYDRPARWNPGQVLDHRRFISDSACEFQRQQVGILRAARGDWFITHNGLMGYIDYARFAQDLDFLGVDLYPGFGGSAHFIPFGADRCRSAAGNFVVPELQSGPGGQVGYILKTPPPGQMRLWAYQCIAHGADAVLHFRWRTCRFGAEEYWCGVLDHDNKPRRRYEEFSREGNELRHIGQDILGTSVEIHAGVLVQYEQEWAHEAMPLNMPSPVDQARLAHQELWRRKVAVGLVEATDGFAGLRLLVVPSFTMLDEDLAARLEAFVRAGGTLLLTAWTGTRDRHNRIVPLTPPGLLAGLVGATVEEYGRLDEGENSLALNGASVPARMWYEVVMPTSAEAAATWRQQAYAGKPGLTLNRVGGGKALYLGTYLSDRNVAAIFDLALDQAALGPLAPGLPEPVEACLRVGRGRRVWFLLNHSDQPQRLAGAPAGRDLITGQRVTGELSLAGRDVAVIVQEPLP